MQRVLAMVLAGGNGTRLAPLTRGLPKPMMPMGGMLRLIDVPLSNCVNSGLRRIYVLTQHQQLPVQHHLAESWHLFSPELQEFIEALPPSRRRSDNWYLGTADAVYQNLDTVQECAAEHVLVLSADHVYRANYARLLQRHLESRSDVTILAARVPAAEAGRFGVLRLGEKGAVTGFREKPALESGLVFPEEPWLRRSVDPLVSMGVYLFRREALEEALQRDAVLGSSTHDFGRDVLPAMVERGKQVQAMVFWDEAESRPGYWKDVGTLDDYFEANMELVSPRARFALFDPSWPMRAAAQAACPAKVGFGESGRMGMAVDSLLSSGARVTGAVVVRSVLGPNVVVESGSELQECVVMEGAVIGRNCRLRRAIVDREMRVPEGTEVGQGPEESRRDARRHGYHVSEQGVTVLTVSAHSVVARPRQIHVGALAPAESAVASSEIYTG